MVVCEGEEFALAQCGQLSVRHRHHQRSKVDDGHRLPVTYIHTIDDRGQRAVAGSGQPDYAHGVSNAVNC